VRRRKFTIDQLRQDKQWLIWRGWAYPGRVAACIVCETKTTARVRSVHATAGANGPVCSTCAAKAKLT